MSDPIAIIPIMEKWNKFTYVCPTCDALIEYTLSLSNIPHDIDVTELTCVCGGKCTLLSVHDATILPIPEKKEEIMETMTSTYAESQIADLKAQLANHQNCDYWKSENGRIGSQLIELVNDAYESDKDAEEILTEICSIIDYEPKKEIEFTATIRFTGRIDVPMSEYTNGFDLSDVLGEAYVDINNGDVVIDGYDLEDAEEC